MAEILKIFLYFLYYYFIYGVTVRYNTGYLLYIFVPRLYGPRKQSTGSFHVYLFSDNLFQNKAVVHIWTTGGRDDYDFPILI